MKNPLGLLLLLGVIAVFFAGCQPAAGPASLSIHRVTCYSGGELIVSDYAVGTLSESDGRFSWRSDTTGSDVYAFADCVVQVDAQREPGAVIKLPGIRQ